MQSACLSIAWVSNLPFHALIKMMYDIIHKCETQEAPPQMLFHAAWLDLANQLQRLLKLHTKSKKNKVSEHRQTAQAFSSWAHSVTALNLRPANAFDIIYFEKTLFAQLCIELAGNGLLWFHRHQ